MEELLPGGTGVAAGTHREPWNDPEGLECQAKEVELYPAGIGNHGGLFLGIHVLRSEI